MIIRRKHNSNFTVIPNRIVTDERLTLEAIGLLTYLLTRPDHWQVNAVQLAKHFKVGKNRTYALLKQLVEAEYIQREQTRREGSRQFSCTNYVVYDTAEGHEIEEVKSETFETSANETEPFPQNEDTVISQELSRFPKAVSRESVRIVRTDLVNSLREKLKSAEAGTNAPSVNSQIWKEGRELLKQSPSQANPSIIGKWLKRVPTAEGKVKLLAMMRAAVGAGTADPIGYVTAALGKEYPPLPGYRNIDPLAWERNQRAAIKTKSWSEAWGPPPGKKGCTMPQNLITSELTAALSARKIAA